MTKWNWACFAKSLKGWRVCAGVSVAGYLPEDVQAAIDLAGMTVADSRGACLAGGFFTIDRIVPAAS